MHGPVLAAAVILLGAAIAVIVYWVQVRPARGQERLASITNPPATAAKASAETQWRGLVDRAPLVTSLLRGTSLGEHLQLAILRADWLLRPSELVALIAGAGLFGALVGLVAGRRPVMAVLGMAIGVAIPWLMLKVRQLTRAKQLTAQIPEVMDMLAAALRSGFSFLRGLQLIASQMHPPISREFARVVEEVQFGVSLSEALDNLIRRTQDYDLELVVSAVQTQLEIGGNLAEILDNIGGMIRERVKLAGEIAAATAEGRLSAGILLAMPFGIAFMLSIVNPGFMDPLFTTRLGLMLLLIGGGLMAIGALVIKKLVTIDI